MLLALVDANILLGLAALLASLCGVILTIVSVRSGRTDATKKAQTECYEKLMVLQREAEKMSSELYDYRVTHYGGFGQVENVKDKP